MDVQIDGRRGKLGNGMAWEWAGDRNGSWRGIESGLKRDWAWDEEWDGGWEWDRNWMRTSIGMGWTWEWDRNWMGASGPI